MKKTLLPLAALSLLLFSCKKELPKPVQIMELKLTFLKI